MIYDPRQCLFKNVPQWPRFRPGAMAIPHLMAIESANVERLELITHAGTHIDAPFHLFSESETVNRLPLSHFHASCVALDLRHKEAGSGIGATDLKTYACKTQVGMIVLLKTGWAKKCALTNSEALLDGKRRHFAAFPALIQGAGGAWTRAVAWDEGEME